MGYDSNKEYEVLRNIEDTSCTLLKDWARDEMKKIKENNGVASMSSRRKKSTAEKKKRKVAYEIRRRSKFKRVACTLNSNHSHK